MGDDSANRIVAPTPPPSPTIIPPPSWTAHATKRDKVRTTLGLRGDFYAADVASDLAANSDSADDLLLSPKLGFVFGPWAATELYLNLGYGFHSNDARGATLRLDPVTGEPAERVSPLVRARGADIGVRTLPLPGLQSTLSRWEGALRLRYFSGYPLLEDDSVTAGATALLNARLAYRLPNGLTLALEGFNLLDRDDSDIEYYYPSRLPGEPAEVEDVHFHPVEKPSLRLMVSKRL